MAYTTIDKPSDYFNTVLYTGDGTARDITTGLTSTDWVWIKRRDGVANHRIFDVVRGVHENLQSNTSNAEQNNTQTLTAFGTNTFSLGTDSGSYDVNTSSQTYVSWNWSAGGTGVSNTDGSITSTVSANTTSGFSIVSYTGTGANATVGHGLGVAPAFVIVKDRDNAVSWVVSGDNIGWNKNMYLNVTQAVQTANHFQDTAPTSSLMYLSTDAAVNGSSRNYIMYCFAEKKGFSKFGSYTGNGNADGTFVYTGFKPAWIMFKRTDSANSWPIEDTKRDTFNPADKRVWAEATDGETENGNGLTDFLSNGFKIRQSTTQFNASGGSYIYMAFAENPFVTSTGIPTTAR